MEEETPVNEVVQSIANEFGLKGKSLFGGFHQDKFEVLFFSESQISDDSQRYEANMHDNNNNFKQVFDLEFSDHANLDFSKYLVLTVDRLSNDIIPRNPILKKGILRKSGEHRLQITLKERLRSIVQKWIKLCFFI